MVIFDANGIARPRRIGFASHIGLQLDRPSTGCAKTRLIGENNEVGAGIGCYFHLTIQSQLGAQNKKKKD